MEREGSFGLKALRKIAFPAFDELFRRAQSTNEVVRLRAIMTIGCLGPAAAKASPLLLAEVRKGNFQAAASLAEIGNPAPEIVSAMLGLLEREESNWERWVWRQREIVKAFGVLGPSGADATDKLLVMLCDGVIANSQDWRIAHLRQAIVETLGRIHDQRGLAPLSARLEQVSEPKDLVSGRFASSAHACSFGVWYGRHNSSSDAGKYRAIAPNT